MLQAGVNVAVVLFDLEVTEAWAFPLTWSVFASVYCRPVHVLSIQVTWPPPQTNSRVGGYDFLGGEAEA